MNSHHNINPLLDPNKNFWDRHPYLKGLAKFLPSLAPVETAFIAFLNYIGYRVSANILLSIIGIPIAAFLATLNITFILDQRARIKALQEENTRKDKELLSKNREIADRERIISIKDKQVNFLRSRLPPHKLELFDLVLHFARVIDPKDPEDFEFVLKALWEISSQNDSENPNDESEKNG